MKKLLSALLLICLIIMTYTACSSDIKDTTTFISFSDSSDDYTITKGGTYSLSGVLGGRLEVKAKDDVTMILAGVEITNESDAAITIENTATTVIRTAKGTVNTVTGAGDAAIESKSNIEFFGEGTLTVNGKEKHGISCDGNITVNDGVLSVNSYEHGIKSESVITILGGDIEIVAETGKGIKAEKEFLAEDGNVKIHSIENEGLESKGALTINGGHFDIVAGEDGINAGTSDSTEGTQTEEEQNAPEAIGEDTHLAPDYTNAIPEGGEGTGAVPPEGAQPDRFRPEGRFPMGGEGEQKNNDADASQNTERPQRPEGELPPSDFVVPEGATTSGRGVPFSFEKGQGGGPGRINDDSVLTINGGYIKINCIGDGIDSNGSLTINGGTVIIDGPENSGNGPLDSDGEMIINGGTVLTASSKGMTQMPRSMTQGIISVSFDTALNDGDEIAIMDKDKKIIVEHKVERICELFMFTSPEIKMEESYTVYVNGVEHSAVTAGSDFGAGFPGRGGMGGKGPGGFRPVPPESSGSAVTNE